MIKTKNKILIIIFTFILLVFFPKIVNAKYLNISAPASGSPGSTVNVSISTDCTGRFNVSVSNGTLNGENKYWLEASSASFTVTLGTSGNTTINVSPANPVSFNREDVELSGQSKSVTINSSTSGGNASSSNNASGNNANSGNSNNNNGNDNSKPSTSAELSMITTSPVDFKGFKTASSGPYYVTVENSVTEIKVGATSKNGSTYSVKGNTNLQEGTNKVTVTAKNGSSTKEYYIYVTRKTANNEKVIPNQIDKEEPVEEEKKELRLNNIILDDKLNVKLDPNFSPEIFEYTIMLGDEYIELDEILINAIANIEGAKITIDGNKKLSKGENIVTIALEANGYEKVVYTIKVIKNEIQEAIQTSADIVKIDESILNNSEQKLKKQIIICILTFLIAFIGIIFIAKECYESTNENMQDNENDYNNKKEFGENNILADIYTKNNLNDVDDKEENNKNEEEKVNLDDFFNTNINYYEGKPSHKRRKGKHS